MKTKKILFALFAMVCVMAASVTLTACGSDDEETNVSLAIHLRLLLSIIPLSQLSAFPLTILLILLEKRS